MLKNTPYHIMAELKNIPIMRAHPVLTYIGSDPHPQHTPRVSNAVTGTSDTGFGDSSSTDFEGNLLTLLFKTGRGSSVGNVSAMQAAVPRSILAPGTFKFVEK